MPNTQCYWPMQLLPVKPQKQVQSGCLLLQHKEQDTRLNLDQVNKTVQRLNLTSV